ncbi:MAG: DUF523 domain-containing protein [Candidatus Omnitrophota bacterium]
MILVSACLAGIDCAWDGKNRSREDIKGLVDEGMAIALCPEVLGGRSTPRLRTEVFNGRGQDVLDEKARVLDEKGNDVTHEFIKGASLVLDIVKTHNIKEAVLKAKSPSCGVGKIYDGFFKGNLIEGDGVLASLLKKEGVSCRSI